MINYCPMSTLQERIEELMHETGWTTATQVANAAGVSRSAAAQWLGRALENGMDLDGVTWVVVGSDEMAPRVRVGGQVLIDPAAPLGPGCLLLAEDAAGGWHVRKYQDMGAGRWQAVAADSRAWAPLAGGELRRAVRIKRLSLEV